MYIGKTRLGSIGQNGYRSPLKDSGFSPIQKIWHKFWVGSLIIMITFGVSLTLMIGYLVALSTPFFKIEDVSVKGIRRVGQAELLQKGGLENGVNLLALNLSDVKKKMEAIPWVKTVYLRRELPNKLHITVIEQQPLSLVLFNRDLYFLNREGVLFKKVETREGLTMPILTGLDKDDWDPNGQIRSPLLQDLLSLQHFLSQGRDPLYPDQISEIHYDPDCGFILYTLERGIRITLGKEDLENRVKRLEKIWAAIHKRPDLMSLKGISLQYGQRIIVQGLRPQKGVGT
jgi:cell division protein FtsQ